MLDTTSDQAFDDLTLLAASACDTPIALVSLVDEHRQWFKSRQGLDVPETPRDVAFCSHAILTPGVIFEVSDAAADPRFAGNPLVTGPPFIRFYAGQPLVSADGFAFGTMCVIDTKPRTLTDAQRAALCLAGRQAEAPLDGRRRAGLSEAEQSALDSEIRSLRTHIGERAAFLARAEHALKTPLAVLTGWTGLLARGDALPAAQRQAGIEAMERAVDNLSGQLDDMLDAARSEVLVSELCPELIDLVVALPLIVDELTVLSDAHVIECTSVVAAAVVLADGPSLQQVVAHLVDNALKYSPNGGTVTVEVAVTDDVGIVRVIDEGMGLPEAVDVFEPFLRGVEAKALTRGSGVGLHVVRTLVETMGGTVEARTRSTGGSEFTVRLPLHR